MKKKVRSRTAPKPIVIAEGGKKAPRSRRLFYLYREILLLRHIVSIYEDLLNVLLAVGIDREHGEEDAVIF